MSDARVPVSVCILEATGTNPCHIQATVGQEIQIKFELLDEGGQVTKPGPSRIMIQEHKGLFEYPLDPDCWNEKAKCYKIIGTPTEEHLGARYVNVVFLGCIKFGTITVYVSQNSKRKRSDTDV